jgi:hypothetical protein
MNIDRIREIELKYPVETIRYRQFQVWPLIRFWLWTYCTAKIEPIRGKSKGLSMGQTARLLQSAFYGLSSLAGKYKYITFSDTSERKLIEGVYVDKSIDFITSLLPHTLLIELPLPFHYKKSQIPTSKVVSKIPLYLLEWFNSKMLGTRIQIENEHVVHEILKELGISFDYRSVLIRNLAQYKVGRLLARLYKPSGVIIQCAYTNTGFLKAFKDSGIPVVEVQHGMLSSSHVAYNVFKQTDPSYFPDWFLSYGFRERTFFHKDNFYISQDKVIPVGHYYLDFVNSSNRERSSYLPEISSYKVVVAITGQNLPDLEQQFIDFIFQVADESSDSAFVYIPRNKQSAIYTNKNRPKNIFLIDNRDTYEIIRMSNVHTTMFSTCAIESLALGTPNILVNLNNLAMTHYGDLLRGESTQYVNSINEFVKALRSSINIARDKVITGNSDLIVSEYRRNIINAVKTIFSIEPDAK